MENHISLGDCSGLFFVHIYIYIVFRGNLLIYKLVLASRQQDTVPSTGCRLVVQDEEQIHKSPKDGKLMSYFCYSISTYNMYTSIVPVPTGQ